MNASFGTVTAGFGSSGSITGLAAGASSAAMAVSLNTTTAGTFGGQATLNFVSSGSGTTGAPDQALAPQNVTVSGNVYTPAAAKVNTTTVNFGIVHLGDVVASRNVSVTNSAPTSALNDTLQGNLGGAGGAFSASGAISGLAAQATDGNGFSVSLKTGQAGIFSGTATASFASHNPEMSDLNLGSTNIELLAQVNNFAELALQKTGGSGVLGKAGATYTLDFGTLVQGSAGLDASLAVLNIAVGPADLLSGSFAVGPGSGFVLGGFSPFGNIAAGESHGGLDIGFDSDMIGEFRQTIVISAAGSNASGYFGALGDTTLVLRGSVVAVPEPQTYALMLGGLLGVWLMRRRSQRCVPV